MTPAEFKVRMEVIFGSERDGNYDTEHAHGESDDLMEQTLRDLGYGEGIDVLHDKDRWYA